MHKQCPCGAAGVKSASGSEHILLSSLRCPQLLGSVDTRTEYIISIQEETAGTVAAKTNKSVYVAKHCGAWVSSLLDNCQDCLLENWPKTKRLFLSVCSTVSGAWSCWSSWSLCSVGCGGGHYQRTRACNSPAPANGGNICIGLHTEEALCNTHTCDGKVTFTHAFRFTLCPTVVSLDSVLYFT